MYTALVSRLLFPLHERLKGHDTVRVRRGLEESQWWPRERLAELQLQRLRALLANAGANAPYYRELFREARIIPIPDGTTEIQKLIIGRSLTGVNAFS